MCVARGFGVSVGVSKRSFWRRKRVALARSDVYRRSSNECLIFLVDKDKDNMKAIVATVLIVVATSAYTSFPLRSHGFVSCQEDRFQTSSWSKQRRIAPKCAFYSTTCLSVSQLEQWWEEASSLFQKSKKTRETLVSDPRLDTNIATVVRTAARAYNATSSKPSSGSYTTRKDSRPHLLVSKDGVVDDYNHYRTVALKSTPDRALSILTRDVMELIRTLEDYNQAQDGDLGENILVEGVTFSFFQIGQQYQFQRETNNNNDNTQGDVIMEITAPMEPCSNLCKLPYVNDDRLSPKERISRCKAFLDRLGQVDGLRGWYAKVVQGGTVCVGDRLTLLLVDSNETAN